MKGVAALFCVQNSDNTRDKDDFECNEHKSKLEARVGIMAIEMNFIVVLITVRKLNDGFGTVRKAENEREIVVNNHFRHLLEVYLIRFRQIFE